MELRQNVRHVVGRPDGRAAGVVVMELPGGERAVFLGARLYFNDASGPEVRPGELFLARPYHLDRFAGGPGQAGRFGCRVDGVLAAIARAHVRDDDADAVGRDAKIPGQLITYSERPLRSRPHRELTIGPFG